MREKIKQALISKKNFSELRILRWICEATSGLKYLHSENIIHRDIKPEYKICLYSIIFYFIAIFVICNRNILLTKHNVIKLADFGLSKYTESSVASSILGSRIYMGPELIQCLVDDEGTYDAKKNDVWFDFRFITFILALS